MALVIMGWIIWRHRSNIARLRQGTENRFKRKINNNLILLDMNDVKTLRIGILGFGTVGQEHGNT